MNPDGSSVVRLTQDPAGDFAPAFSPDGSKIAFLSSRSGDRVQDVFVMNADGSGVAQVTHTPEPGPEDREKPGPFGPERPAFHPTGDRLIYSQNFVLFVVPVAGGPPQPLHTIGDDGIDSRRAPVYSPDGGKIAFSGLTSREEEPGSGLFTINQDIFVMNADGSGVVRLTFHPASDSEPNYSHDGNLIVFSRTDDPGADGIFRIPAAGGQAQRVTLAESIDFSPVFSPDDTRIAFSSRGTDDRVDIFTIPVAGGERLRLTVDAGENSEPAWAGSTVKVPQLAVTGFSAPSGEPATLLFNAPSAGRYTLQRSTDLKSWVSVASEDALIPGALTIRDATVRPEHKAFYRINMSHLP